MTKNIFLLFNLIIFSFINTAFATEGTAEASSDASIENNSKTEKEESVITIEDAWARASIGSNNNSAAYMSITNKSDKQITIISASALMVANNVELHKSFVDEQGVSRMTSIDKIIVPADSTISLAPGAIHIMLFDLKKKLTPGSKFKLNLSVENMDPISVDVEVR